MVLHSAYTGCLIGKEEERVRRLCAKFRLLCPFASFLLLFSIATPSDWWSVRSQAQEQTATDQSEPTKLDDKAEEKLAAPTKVEVEPIAEDRQIERRLLRILNATEWFTAPSVRVDEGVVFLTGIARREEHKSWASELSQKTQDVVAVVNRMSVQASPLWDLRPAWREAEELGRNLIRSVPLMLLAVVLVVLTWLLAGITHRLTRFTFSSKLKSPLLAEVAARGVTLLVFVIGLYVSLRISGLTQIAATLLGGTGLIGLIIGIAFRDIAENFLASVLISVQRPFSLGDLIEVDTNKGFVQSVTMRGTLMMTLEGNHLQIPNAIVYKSIIRNLTSNPNVRLQIDIGIGYDDSISHVQQVILNVLQDHEAVLNHPEPMVLADTFATSSVNLRCYAWIDTSKHSALRVRSSLLRLIKQAIQDEGVSIPDGAREVIFPREIPIKIVHEQPTVFHDNNRTDTLYDGSISNLVKPHVAPSIHSEEELRESVTEAEGGLMSEADEIKEQARNARKPEGGENLLMPDGEFKKVDAAVNVDRQ
ncbi:MAG: mechanosensitive ion channel [Pirellula sp.]|nr:mechanosensitive ion channel [Pirellula sp.]